ncbi:MAG: hypothetical protein ACD_33C00002G0009 [uncultured bacterium]|nr:MAG: hypothetical protein ACD_33C00002G0009 [uncultured bacterium]
MKTLDFQSLKKTIPLQDVCQDVLKMKYFKNNDASREDVLDRTVKGLVANETNKEKYTKEFREALDYCILGGRINASSGVEGIQTTYINCFVQPVADSVYENIGDTPSIMEAVKQAAHTMRLGGGVGYDFSKLRPKGSWIKKTKSTASGPISYMEIFNVTCNTVISSGLRRGAQIGILRCEHPDIEEFIICKKSDDPNIPYHKRPFSNFNLSVGITDALMKAVEADEDFELSHIAEPGPELKEKGAYQKPNGIWVYKKVKAKEFYDRIIKATYDRAEPGVVFLDRINEDNNLRYIEVIEATNPCGEQPLPPYGCCDLGHLNLTKFINKTVWDVTGYEFNWNKIKEVIPSLVRMLDNVLDLTPWPLEEQKKEAQSKRRVGIGITGLGDTLIMLGLKYDSDEGRMFAKNIMETIRNESYLASIELAKEKGAFPLFKAEGYLEGESKHLSRKGTFASRLPNNIKEEIRKYGIRNSHLITLAPTGTGSLTFGNNCSSGCEPVFDFIQKRYIRQEDNTRKEVDLLDYAYLVYKEQGGDINNLPNYFESVSTLSVDGHLKMLECLAPYVDSAISKTVNVPSDYSFEDFKNIYIQAWKSGLKGITTYRPNNGLESVIVSASTSNKDLVKLESINFDSRFKLNKIPESSLSNLKWLDRPNMIDGNPGYSYMVNCPYGDFIIQIGHYVNNETQPFEVWVNGANLPRGLGAVAKSLSADMRTQDRAWLEFKLKSLAKCDGNTFHIEMPPTGEQIMVSSPVAAFAKILQYHCSKINWIDNKEDSNLLNSVMFNKEPKTGTNGTLSWTVDIKNPATNDDFVLFVKELELPDGIHRPYSIWLAGEYPKALDGLCRILSIDMRVIDPSWIKMKLNKLLNYSEAQGDFLAKVPGSEKQQSFSSTIAYIAKLLLYRYEQLGVFNKDKEIIDVENTKSNILNSNYMTGSKCPECNVNAVIVYNGCSRCSNCGFEGGCG